MKPETMLDFANALLSVRVNTCADPADLLPAKVDRLGLIRAEISKLKDEAELIRADLEAAGLKHIEGTFYGATLIACYTGDVTNWQAIAKRLGASPQLIRAHTKRGTDYTKLLLTAKKITH